MQNNRTRISTTLKSVAILFFALIAVKSNAQSNADSTVGKGKIWGYAFADLFTKTHADSLNRGKNNQYTNVNQGATAFQFRRVYLGYDYNLDKHFTAEFLLAAEDDFAGGDLLGNGKFTPYLKWCNIQWKGIYPGATLTLGQSETPAFAMAGESEPTWAYRSIERTITDVRRTPSFDMGARLAGQFVPGNDNYGYILMVGNGNGDKTVIDNTTTLNNNSFKWYYGDLYAKFMNKKLLVDLYGDYQDLNYTSSWKHTRQMGKIFVAYTVPKLTVGVEAYMNMLNKDVIATEKAAPKKIDTLNTTAMGVSVFVRGVAVKDKLNFFARYDVYNPNAATGADKYDATVYSAFKNQSSNYNPTVSEAFITAGLDYTPNKNVHIMPNIWYNQYTSNNSTLSSNAKLAKTDYDMAVRLTFFYRFGGKRLN